MMHIGSVEILILWAVGGFALGMILKGTKLAWSFGRTLFLAAGWLAAGILSIAIFQQTVIQGFIIGAVAGFITLSKVRGAQKKALKE